MKDANAATFARLPHDEKALVFLLGTSSAEVATAVSKAAASAGVGLRLAETAPEALRTALASPPDAILLDVDIAGGMSASELVFTLRDETATGSLPVLLVGSPTDRNAERLVRAATAFSGVDICPTVDPTHLELRIKWTATLCRSLARVRELEGKVHDLMTTDPVTGLYNHHETLRLLGSQCRIVDRYGRDLSVVYADIDYLGLFNEQYGLEAGNQVLSTFAAAARQCCRAADIVGRLGGGDFLAILPETSLEGARTVAERIRTDFEKEVSSQFAGKTLPVTVSLVCAQKLPSENEHRLLARVGRALRRAKESGRDRVTVAPSDPGAPGVAG